MAIRTSYLEYRRRSLEIGVIALLYFGAARLGLLMAFTNKNISPVWPPSGFALAAILMRGTRVWPAIFLGAFLANFSNGLTLPIALTIGIGNTLEALTGAYLLRRVHFRYHHGRIRDVLGLILLGGMVSPLVAATIGVAILRIAGSIAPSALPAAWFTWWLGDGMGILVIAPVCLTWAAPLTTLRSWPQSAGPWRILEAGALLSSLAGIMHFIFYNGQAYPYAVFPFLIWAAMRFGPRGATSAILVISGLAVWGTLEDLGPFVRDTPEQSLEFLQTFMGVVSITTLVMAAALSERKRSKETQSRLLAEVQRQRKRLDDILATVPALVWEAYGKPDSATQRIDFVSDHVRTMLGYAVEEWLSVPHFWLDIVHPEDREQALRSADEAFDSGMPHQNRFRWIAKDGRVVWTEAHAVTIRDADGHPIGMRGVNTDITDRKQAEEERERLVLELQCHQRDIEELNEQLRRSVAETHHRVKNNLQIICALVEIQEMRGTVQTLPSEFRRLSQHVRSLAVIHDLLTHETRANANADHIRLQDAIHELMPLLQPLVGDRRLHYTVDDALVSTRQGTALAMLVNELVSNALKHGAGDIDLSVVVQESTIRLEICDNGPGFPPPFDPRTSAGMGMELIRSLSTWDLGGQVAFENRPEGGARVLVTFPLTRQTDENESTIHATSEKSRAAEC